MVAGQNSGLPETPRVKALRRAAAGLIVLLWLAALCFPSLGTCRDGVTTWFDNSTVLFFGWAGAVSGMMGWYANLFLCRCVYFLASGRVPTLTMGLFTFLLACSSFVPAELAHNEATSEPLCAWGAGFWLWFGCAGAAFLLAIHGALHVAWAGRTSP